MNWIFCIALLVGFGVEGQHISPLTNANPGKALALHWAQRSSWMKEHASDLDEVSGIQNLLISTATNLQNGSTNNSACIYSLASFGVDIIFKKTYTYKALDASGKLDSGILLGNMRWNGRYYECLDAHGDHFNGKWCTTFIGQPTSAFGLPVGATIGTCVPDTCSQEYLTSILQPLANKTGQAVIVQCPVQPTEWTPTDIASLCVFMIFVGLLIMGSVWDLVVTHLERRDNERLSISGDGIVAENIYLHHKQTQSVLTKVALSFSVFKNTKTLMDTSTRPGQIGALHGLRFISMTWVVLGHTYVIPAMLIDNVMDVGNWFLRSFTFETLANGTFSVDTFFFISGVLVTYLGLREMHRRNGKINVFSFYLHRYIRLTPAYALLIFIFMGFFDKLGDGPLWPDSVIASQKVCFKYWWTNLLYINNLHPGGLTEECFAWGWYMANDMQFFLLVPISLILLYRIPKVGISVLIFGLFSNLLVTGLISKHYKLQPQTIGIAQLFGSLGGIVTVHDDHSPSSYNGSVDLNPPAMPQSDIFWSDTYGKPWCRIGVYLIGILTGYILHMTKLRIKMHKVAVALGWIIATGLNLSVLYGLWSYVKDAAPMSVSLAAFYNALSRPIWAVGLGWLTVACACGYGGPVNKFLSWKVFIPLSRLTYCAYLVHPMVMILVAASQELYLHFSNRTFAVYFVAYLVLSYAAAYAIYVLVEAPVICLQKVMFVHRKEEIPAMDEVTRTLLVNEQTMNQDEE